METTTLALSSPAQSASLENAYTPPIAIGTTSTVQSSTLVHNPNPTTPAFQDDDQWVHAYLAIHKMSPASYRYAYILWLIVIFIFLVFAVLHWTGLRGGLVGGFWSKWSLRRRTWRKQHALTEAQRKNNPHKQPWPLPSNAQLLSIAVLYIATLVLCFLGPDYIAPGTQPWDFSRSVTTRDAPGDVTAPPQNTVSNLPPAYTIPKAWWTAGGRTGTIAFALFPLCILFALKAPPFALFALPFLVQIYNDKLAFLHRWSGRLIWFITALHVALWGVQLGRDKRGTDDPSSIWNFAFQYDKFVYGWLGFICLTALVALSFRPIRVEFYEMFYLLHVILIPLTLVFSALHFPPFWWWCWAALALWAGERCWRAIRFIRINGIIGGLRGRRHARYVATVNEKVSRSSKPISMGLYHSGPFPPSQSLARDNSDTSESSDAPLYSSTDGSGVDVTEGRRLDSNDFPVPYRTRPLSAGQDTIKSFQTGSSVELISNVAPLGTSELPLSQFSNKFGMTPPLHQYAAGPTGVESPSRTTYIPPPGYAHVTLLPGRSIRLKLIPPHHFSWAPGQYVLLTIPSVSKLTTHPFTIASVCDNEAASDEDRELMILVRARTGFTKDLWNHIEQLEESGKIGDIPNTQYYPPKQGVLLRAYIDGPFGSSIRARWTSYSTVVLIAGGSGVSFTTSILEYACMCLAGRNGKQLGKNPGGMGLPTVSQIRRVRFIWIVREYSHIQWIAPTIRRCMNLVPTTALQVDIFVTNVSSRGRPGVSSDLISSRGEGGTLAPPTPRFAYSGRNGSDSNASDTSLASATSVNSDSPYLVPIRPSREATNDVLDILEMYNQLDHQEHPLDLTNFDGEDDTRLPGEMQLSNRLRKEGKHRRAKTRKSELAWLAKGDLQDRSANMHQQLPPTPQGHVPSTYRERPRSRSPLSPNILSPRKSEGQISPVEDELLTPGVYPMSPLTPQGQTSHSFLNIDGSSRSIFPVPSGRSGMYKSNNVESPRTVHNAEHSRKPSIFDMDVTEAEDVSYVAERARPGKPRIDRIVADEASRTLGTMVVACCGPTSLNAVVRKSVAAQIDPSRIHRGESASITLVSEDFEW